MRAEERETALLAAAALPASGRPPRLLLVEAVQRPFPLLDRAGPLRPNGVARVGQVANHHEELMVAMNVLDGVLRSPLPFAHLLEAAAHRAVMCTGRVLARRVGLEAGPGDLGG